MCPLCRRRRLHFVRQGRRRLGQRQKTVHVESFFGRLSQYVYTIRQILYFVGRHQSQVTARYDRFFHIRQTAVRFKARLFLPQYLIVFINGLTHIVDNESFYAAVGAKIGHAFQHGRNRRGRTLAVDDKDYGSLRHPRQVVGAIVARKSEAVIKSHGPFENGYSFLFSRLTEKTFGHCLSPAVTAEEKKVQVIRPGTRHDGMKHGINVIGTAFKGTDGTFSLNERPQKSAGHGRLAAAAGRRRQKQARHGLTRHDPPPEPQHS